MSFKNHFYAAEKLCYGVGEDECEDLSRNMTKQMHYNIGFELNGKANVLPENTLSWKLPI